MGSEHALTQASFVNTSDHQLNRLLKAASRAPGETTCAMSSVLEERTMANWANTAAVDNGCLWTLPQLRRALALAYALALAALAFHYYEPAPPSADEVAVVNSSIALSDLP